MSNEMNTGPMPSTSKELNANGKQKKTFAINGPDMMTHSNSQSRGEGMKLNPSAYKLMKPSNRDQFQ